MAGTVHKAKKLVISFNVSLCDTIPNVTKVYINTLTVYLKTIDWNYIFAGCTDMNQDVQRFNEVKQSAYEVSQFTVVFHRQENLPRDILHLIHIKNHARRDAVNAGCKDNFRANTKA